MKPSLATLRRTWPWIVLVAASFLFRLPALEHAAGMNSDVAVVGLQALHLLRGEHAAFLWGSGYQTAVDSYVAAGWFALRGATPMVLRLSALAGHVALTGLCFATVRRHVRDEVTALVLVGPLVLSPWVVHCFALYPPRQASLTLAMLAVFLLDRAELASRPLARLGAGAAVAGLAVFADPYALVFLPAAGLLALGASWGKPLRACAARLAAAAAGAAVGALPYLWLVHRADASHGVYSMTQGVLEHNLGLLRDPCGPWVLGTRILAPNAEGTYVPWPAPLAAGVVQWAGAGAVLALGVGAALLLANKRVAAPTRRLGGAGLVTALGTFGGFLTSQMVMDKYSTRYLAAMVLVLPLWLTPAAVLLRRRFALALAPFVASCALCGWLGFSRMSERPEDLARFEQALQAEGVSNAVADYWAAYRLTWLTHERVMVMPWHESQDRYPAYREAYRRAPAVAYLFDHIHSDEDREHRLAQILQPGDLRLRRRFTVSGIDVAVLDRVPAP